MATLTIYAMPLLQNIKQSCLQRSAIAKTVNEDKNLRSLLTASALPPAEAKILMAYILEKHYQLPRTALLSRDEMFLNAPALADWKEIEGKRLNGSLLPI